MINYKMKWIFIYFLTGTLFVVGCIPERSLEWCPDGSVGLLQYDKEFYLVDGQTGVLTEVAKGNAMPWPDISDDGKLIAYSDRVECDNLTKGLKQLPENQVRGIKAHAEWLKKDIIAKGLHFEGTFPRLEKIRHRNPYGTDKDITSEYTVEYCAWVIRYMCENADGELTKKLTSELVSEGKGLRLAYYRLIVVPRERLADKKIVVTSVSAIFKVMFSPDSSHIAYLMLNPEGSKESYVLENMSYMLCVASPKQNIKAMRIAHDVAFGYDWRQDGQAIAYMQGDITNDEIADEDITLGEIAEVEVADANGILLAEKIDAIDGFITHICRGQTNSPVGVVFYPWSKLEYGPGGRIFFVSFALTIPAITHEDPPLSLFCYDSVTKTVSNVLPLALSGYIDGAVPAFQFSLSHDGKKVLLPLRDNRFMIYELGSTSTELPIEENEGFGNEGFGDDTDLLAPAWKGKNEISCIVSEKSHFLTKEGQGKHHRKEIVILGKDGKLKGVLSKNWPGDIAETTAEKGSSELAIEQLLK